MKVVIGKILLSLILVSCVVAKEVGIENPPPPAPPDIVRWLPLSINRYKCTIKKVKDADTFVCDVNIPEFQVILVNQDIRILAYDAPEISHKRQSVKVTAEEIENGLEAKKYFEYLVKNYDFYVCPKVGSKDPYGRFLCSVYFSDKKHENLYVNYSEFMTAKGYVR